jgi:hypothetical protein
MTWKLDANGKMVFINDGYGYKNNPELGDIPNPEMLDTFVPLPKSPGTKDDPSNDQVDESLKPVGTKPMIKWSKFIDGTLREQSGATVGAISGEPYISYGTLADSTANPRSIVVLPTTGWIGPETGGGVRQIRKDYDGEAGFYVQDLDSAVQEYINRILPSDIVRYKFQLQDYYAGGGGGKDFAVSVETNPEDKDLGFAKAVKKMLQALSIDNFKRGVSIAQAKKVNPAYDATGELYDVEGFVASRNPLPPKVSESERSSQLTTEQDALREFYRTVQEYVGDPLLVDELDKLAKQYVKDLRAAETDPSRISRSTSTTNRTGTQRTSASVSFSQLNDVDRLEMRIKLITKGSKIAKSTGIKLVDPTKLQDAGGKIGNYYTDLTEYSYKTGIKLSPETLLSKVSEMNKPGGSIEEQQRTLMQASKLKYKALAPYIDAGIMPGDFIADLVAIKARELDLNEQQVNIFDEDIQKAISGDTLLGPEDFTNLTRKNPNWRYGSTANNLAAQFINSISTTFGKIG